MENTRRNFFHYFFLFLILIFAFSISMLFITSCGKNNETLDYTAKAQNAENNQNQNSNNSEQNSSNIDVSNLSSTEIALALQNSYRKIAKSSLPAVVHITSVVKTEAPEVPFWFPFIPEMPQEQEYLGSGFIISKEGYILTNNHVIQNAKEVKVLLMDGAQFKAKVLGADPDMDVALLKIDPKNKTLPILKLGDSDKIEVGDIVIAIGNPFGLDGTVTHGIVSAKGRYNIGLNRYVDFIQIDAAINPGNSGGPLLNINGEVIGINTAILSKTGQSAGIGLAIPINLVKNILDNLKKGKPIEKGYLGVVIKDLTPKQADYYEMKKPEGVIILQVEKNSPAEKAGIKPADVIIEFNGKKIKNSIDLIKAVSLLPVGKTVAIKLIRIINGKKKIIETKITIGKRSKNKVSIIKKNWLGVGVSPITDDLKKKFGIYGLNRGVVVVSIEENSLAAKAGIEVGDVILQINNYQINDIEDFYKIIDKVKKEKKFLFFIYRRGAILVITIRK